MPNEIYHRSEWGNPKAEGFGDVYFDPAATNKLYNHSDNYENSDGTDKILRDIPNKASIVLTPTAYSDGSLNTVIPPYQVLPQELVTNGDFSDGTNNWTLDDASNGSISVVDGKLEIVSNGGAGYPVVKQGISTSIGKKYSVTFSVTNNTTGFWFRVSQFESHLSGDTTFYANDKTSLINFKGEFTAISTTSYLKIFAEQNDAGSFQIDDISIKEIQEADFDFSRGSSATRVNEKGLIEDVASGIPRIDYTSGQGALLLEPQSTNYSRNSEQPSTWHSSNGVTITADATTSPDGTTNASLVVINTSSDLRYARNLIVFPSGSGTQAVTLSCFLKYYNNQWVRLKSAFFTGSAANNEGSFFDIQNGVLGTVNSNQTAKMEDYGNGWYRCSITFDIDKDTDSNGYMVVETMSNDDTNTYAAIGQGVYAFGSQGEELSFMTSYIPLPTVNSVTRSADVANNSGNADLFNDSEGVLYAEIAALADDGTFRSISISSDAGYNNSIMIRYISTSNQVNVITRISGALNNTSVDVNDITEFNKIAFKYKSEDCALFINGVKVATSTQAFNSSGINNLSFDRGNGGTPFYGNVKSLAVFKEALTDAELESLTSWVSFTEMATDLEYTVE